jgi:hypothetical protein
MVEMKLSPVEMTFAAVVGAIRQIQALRDGLPDRHGCSGENGWTHHIEGALGEYVVAKALGITWTGHAGVFHDVADVGIDVEVRTRSRHDYDLIVREQDRPDRFYVLVTGRAPSFRIRGFIYGGEAKEPKWIKTYGNRPPAFFVPADCLEAFEHLKRR